MGQVGSFDNLSWALFYLWSLSWDHCACSLVLSVLFAHHPVACSHNGCNMFIREMQRPRRRWRRTIPGLGTNWCSFTSNEFCWQMESEGLPVVKGRGNTLRLLMVGAEMGLDVGRSKGLCAFSPSATCGHNYFHLTGERIEIQSLHDTRLCRF